MARKPRPKLTEKEKIDRSFKRLISDIDKLERQWAALPEDVRRRNPDLARFFSKPEGGAK